MRRIEKGPEPPELLEYKSTPGVHFKHAPLKVKEPIRRHGVRDQFFICCYCCSRIGQLGQYQQIEHIAPQAMASERSLDWQNLLVSCASGRPEFSPDRKSLEICDDHKGDEALPISPLDPDCESHFRYDPIEGLLVVARLDDRAAKRTIEVLNLNCTRLRVNRRTAMEDAATYIDTLPFDEWKARFLEPVDGMLSEYEPAIRSLNSHFTNILQG